MKPISLYIKSPLILFSVLFFFSCDFSVDDRPSPPTVDVSGNWRGQSSDGIGFRATMVQTGSNLSGGVVRSDGIRGYIAGSVEKNRASWKMVWDVGTTGSYKGTVDGNQMTGTFSEDWQGVKLSGTFSATR